MTLKETARSYYYLTKPGIIRGNVIVASAGFFFASNGNINFMRFVYMLFGLSLIIACACVLNNILDIEIDKKMDRTKKRALVTGAIKPQQAYVFASTLGVIGTLLLAKTNLVTLFTALFGLFAYVVIYGIGKRTTTFGTIIGSISGAVPPVVGYVAVTGSIDVKALRLFIVLVLWQMPHFYAIATFRKSDYTAAALPVMPVVRDSSTVRRRMIGYTIAFSVAVLAFKAFGYVGWTYAAVMTCLSLYWIYLALKKHTASEEIRWARGLFGFSLVTLLVWSALISLNWLLP